MMAIFSRRRLGLTVATLALAIPSTVAATSIEPVFRNPNRIVVDHFVNAEDSVSRQLRLIGGILPDLVAILDHELQDVGYDIEVLPRATYTQPEEFPARVLYARVRIDVEIQNIEGVERFVGSIGLFLQRKNLSPIESPAPRTHFVSSEADLVAVVAAAATVQLRAGLVDLLDYRAGE